MTNVIIFKNYIVFLPDFSNQVFTHPVAKCVFAFLLFCVNICQHLLHYHIFLIVCARPHAIIWSQVSHHCARRIVQLKSCRPVNQAKALPSGAYHLLTSDTKPTNLSVFAKDQAHKSSLTHPVNIRYNPDKLVFLSETTLVNSSFIPLVV